MTISKQKTFDNKLIEPRDPEPKKVQCRYCRKKFKVITKKHLDVCKPYQEHLEKAKKDQKLIFDFCEKIERKSYPVDLIFPNPWNVNFMGTEDFEGLKESIRKTKGEYLKKNPIQIRELESDKYEIIDGEHRWKACKELGFAKIPAILENDVNIEEAKVMNVLYSKDRGKIDYFRLSKLLNEEYYDENGKRKCTQQKLADRFGFNRNNLKNILPIFPRLEKYKDQLVARHQFSNRQLEAISRCKNELLREKLIEQSIKEKINSKKIRILATKFNKLERHLERDYNNPTRLCILNVFIGHSLFDLSYNELIEKIFNFVDKYDNLEHFVKCRDKFERDFILHSRDAENFKDKYIKENKTWTDWYNTYTRSSDFRTPSLMSWKFFTEFYHENVNCIRCGKRIKNFNEYTPHHHEDYEFKDNHLWHIFLEGDQKISPCHTKCHQKGTSKNWNKKLEE